MAHSLTRALATPPITTQRKTHNPFSFFQKDSQLNRRNLTLGLTGAVLALTVGNHNASAAARRPPAPPPGEKKDPNVSGVTAKILASKKRKEAMQEAIAKLREKGKPIS